MSLKRPLIPHLYGKAYHTWLSNHTTTGCPNIPHQVVQSYHTWLSNHTTPVWQCIPHLYRHRYHLYHDYYYYPRLGVLVGGRVVLRGRVKVLQFRLSLNMSIIDHPPLSTWEPRTRSDTTAKKNGDGRDIINITIIITIIIIIAVTIIITIIAVIIISVIIISMHATRPWCDSMRASLEPNRAEP